MIRLARLADLPQINAVAHDAFAGYVPLIGRKPQPMTEDYAVLIAAGAVHVTDDLAGFLVTEREGDALTIDVVAVAPAAQGRGIGKALMMQAETVALASGLTRITLYTNAKMAANLAIYPRLGYAETDRRHDNGFDRVFFEKTLARD